MVIVNKREYNPKVTFRELERGDIFYYEDAETYYIKLTADILSPNAFCIETNMLCKFHNLDTPVTKVNAEVILKN